ncbi:MAG: hypothetical protein KGS72_18010 [Cyanobacteria bacterium REEB67]|nr:hypothetical protein [Cyanobacteria bacterium REEB67]
MSDFAAEFGKVADLVNGAAKGVLNKFDQMLFNALVGCLKSDDYEAVKVAVDQLVKENRPVSIPPLYFVSKAHPNERAREKARVALSQFKQDEKIQELTAGKEVKDAVVALVKEFGNYRQG